MFTNFFKDNLDPNLAYDEYVNPAGEFIRETRAKKNKYDFGMSYAPGYTPQNTKSPVYTGEKARSKVNEAINTMNELKSRNANSSTFDPLSVIPDSATKKKRSDDDDEEDDGPTLAERYLKEVQRIQSGNFKYSSTEKANLENIRRTGRDMELRQSRVNDNYQGGTLQGEQVSGRSRYAQDMADDAMINALQFGTERINDIDLQTSKGVAELESAIKEQRLRDIATKYGFLQQQDQMRIEETANIQEALIEAQKAQAIIDNYNRTNDTRNYEFSVLNPGFNSFLAQQEKNELYSKYAPSSSTSNTGGIDWDAILS